MSDELTRVTAALEALGDDATAEEVADAIEIYSKRDIIAAMFSLSNAGSGDGLGLALNANPDNPLPAGAGEMFLYFDAAPGNAKLKILARDTNGDQIYGEIALNPF